MPFHHENLPKGIIFTYLEVLEDPGMLDFWDVTGFSGVLPVGTPPLVKGLNLVLLSEG